MPNIMIDFDGVIHRYSKKWNGGSIYDPPVKGVKDALRFLKEELGYKIIVFTTRVLTDPEETQRRSMKTWLKNHEIPYDAITCKKLPATIYIDDRGFRFSGTWVENLPVIIKLMESNRLEELKKIE